MASLANQSISSTYDGLIKTSSDQPVPASGVQLLEDGVGNTLALSVGRANNGVTITGTVNAANLSVTGTILDSDGDAGTSGQVLSSTGTGTNWIDAGGGGTIDGSGTANYITKWLDTDTITDSVIYESSGNIGIGTSSPLAKMNISDTDSNFTALLLDNFNTTDAGTETTEINFRHYRSYNPSVTDAGKIVVGKETAWNATDTRNSYMSFHTRDGATEPEERMRITSDGNVGIGTSSPTHKVEILGSNASTLLLNNDGSQYTQLLFENNGSSNSGADFLLDHTNSLFKHRSLRGGQAITFETAVTSGAPIERMRIDSSGSVGIGTTAPARTLHIYSGNTNEAVRIESADTAVVLELKDSVGTSKIESRGDFRFSTNSGEKMRLLDTGELYIAGTADRGSYNLQCNGTGVWGQGAYVNGSDIRFKEQIKPIESGLDVVEKLKPVSYKYKKEFSRDVTTQAGFIAQDLQVALEGKEYLDGIVKSDSEYLSVAYQSLIPILTKAIQELRAEVESLKSQLNA